MGIYVKTYDQIANIFCRINRIVFYYPIIQLNKINLTVQTSLNLNKITNINNKLIFSNIILGQLLMISFKQQTIETNHNYN